MTHEDIVAKLIGSVNPVADSAIDAERFKNLEDLCLLTEQLIRKIKRVAACKDQYEHSIKKAAKYADDFLNELKLEI